MSAKNFFFKNLLALGVSSLSLSSHAHGLLIANSTNFDSTCKINGGSCSNIYGEKDGVTKAHDLNHAVSPGLVKVACAANPSNCQAAIYMNNHCGGKPIGCVVFDVDNGIKSIGNCATEMDPQYKNYSIIGGGYNITISGGL